MNRTPRVSVNIRGTVGILSITGDMTNPDDLAFQNAYNEAEQRGASKFLLKFQPQSFVNSAGLRLILSVVFKADEAGKPVRATGLSAHMTTIFGLVGLDQYVTIYPTESAALKGWA